MDTYTRQIKFCYYKVAQATIDEKGDAHVTGKFNLVEWLMNLADKGKIKHHIQLSDSVVMLEDYAKYTDKDIYAIRAYKLRDGNIPSKVKDGESATPIPLEADEYIGEDLNFLYDRNNSICMIQQNRMSIGISRLVEWINMECPIDNGKILFLPISDQFDTGRFKDKSIRSIEFSFANFELSDTSGSLKQIIDGVTKYKGLTGKITISVGRDKNAQLDNGSIVDLVEEIRCNPGVVNSARLKYKDQRLDDDKPRMEIVDLFENSLHDYIRFDIEVRKPLDFNSARVKMFETYSLKVEKLEGLCQW